MKWLFFSLCLLSLGSLFVGVSQLSVISLIELDSDAWDLLITSRLPRLLAILLAGAGLSIAGLVMQQISQNKFAAPSTSGTIECAMLGYMLSLLLFGNGDALWLIFLTAIIGTLVFVKLIQSIQFKNAIFVPLIGIIFGNIIQSLVTFIAYKFDALQNLSNWSLANFSNILQGDFELLYIAIPCAIITYLYANQISAVGIGKSFATNLGLKYGQIVTIGVILVSMMAATVVMIVGELPFLGLIVPNIVAYYQGDNLKKNLPNTALLGACVVLVCDLISRIIIFPYELPVSMFISIIGGLVFIVLLLKREANDR
ncbi:ABC transporter permease [Psychromonas sp. GE-S-Ul-11]|uniref:ABC transporter permease n=1 Tax=unclassified Psychromonas TaxID=2614957 RepID=UPI00390C65AF